MNNDECIASYSHNNETYQLYELDKYMVWISYEKIEKDLLYNVDLKTINSYSLRIRDGKIVWESPEYDINIPLCCREYFERVLKLRAFS